MRIFKPFFCLFLLCASLQLAHGQPAHQVAFMTGSTGNKIEVLDWGGKGEAIIFLTGLSHNAHVFDDFAPRFTDRYHVYGMTRRGYGASEITKHGYSTDTLVQDIFRVVEGLGIKKVILIGHSIAGDELSRFASSYPDRTSRVVFLDAAFSHNETDEKVPVRPAFPPPTEADKASIQHYNAHLKRTRGVAFPEHHLQYMFRWSATGALQEPVSPASVTAALRAGISLISYKRMACPALAIYAQSTSAPELFGDRYAAFDLATKQMAADYLDFHIRNNQLEISRFKSEARKGTVIVFPGVGHGFYLSHPQETEAMIRKFLVASK
jgi:pimeloyl-ACP methyl ester carboxylesterase